MAIEELFYPVAAPDDSFNNGRGVGAMDSYNINIPAMSGLGWSILGNTTCLVGIIRETISSEIQHSIMRQSQWQSKRKRCKLIFETITKVV